MRLVLSSRGDAYDSAALLEEFERNADTVKAFTPQGVDRPSTIPADRVLHPFFGSESGPDPGGVLRHFASIPPDEVFEVLVLGGSVAMLFCRDAGKELEEALSADSRLAGRKVRVLHGGHAAYKQPQQLNKLSYIFAHGYRPDVVINLDGFNEVANGVNNGLSGIHPLYPTPPVWAGLLWGRSDADAELTVDRARLAQLGERYKEFLGKAKRLGLMRSALTGSWVRSRLRALQNQRADLQNELTERQDPSALHQRRAASRELNGDSYDREESAIVDLSVRNWVECSLSMSAMCAARGVLYLHVLQPTLWDKDAKPIAQKEQNLRGAAGWRKGVKLGYPRLRASVPELEAGGVHFLDLSMSFAKVEEPLYFDPCHFVPEGSKMLVPELARGVLALLR